MYSEKMNVPEHSDIRKIDIGRIGEQAAALRQTVRSVFVAPDETIDLLIIALFSGLHLLVEDIPGVGKTTVARALAAAAGMDFGRIQCTPDLLPGDVTGMYIWDPASGVFRFRQGAVMHQFLLVDELNRASTRTQAALLEAMQEGGVTVDDVTHPLPKPFFVFATENPATFAGTFGLPESQLDRFGLRVSFGYPARDDEREILSRPIEPFVSDSITPVCTPEMISEIRGAVESIHVDAKVADFIIDLLSRTRTSGLVRLGASPRAGMHLQHAARTRALLAGRSFVQPEDVTSMAEPVLAHRIQPSAEARMEQQSAGRIISSIVSRLPMPAGVPSASGSGR